MNWSHCPRPPSPFLPSICIHEVSVVGGGIVCYCYYYRAAQHAWQLSYSSLLD